MSDTMPRFIVGEISKNWPEESDGLISERFEKMIHYNELRGYRLHSWALDRIGDWDDGVMNETIIAVFELKEKP
jgi:hypothetical protein